MYVCCLRPAGGCLLSFSFCASPLAFVALQLPRSEAKSLRPADKEGQKVVAAREVKERCARLNELMADLAKQQTIGELTTRWYSNLKWRAHRCLRNGRRQVLARRPAAVVG